MREKLRILWHRLTAPLRFMVWLLWWVARQVKNTYLYLHHFLTYEPEDSDLVDTVQKAVQRPRELLPHLDALRKHIFRAVLIYIITTGFSFAYASPILAYLTRPLPGGVSSLQVIEVTEPISVFMRVSRYAARAAGVIRLDLAMTSPCTRSRISVLCVLSITALKRAERMKVMMT